MKKIFHILLVSLTVFILAGCTTALQSDKIISIKTRCFGVIIETSSMSANSVPTVKLGFISQVVQLIPTSTNVLYAPNYMDTFDLGQGMSPFSTTISEDTGTGNVMLDPGTATIITTNKMGLATTNHAPYKLGARLRSPKLL
jgi:hypothetical protein